MDLKPELWHGAVDDGDGMVVSVPSTKHWVRTGAQSALPAWFRAEVTDPAFPYDLVIDFEVQTSVGVICKEVLVRSRNPAVPVRSAQLREVPLKQLERRATRLAARYLYEGGGLGPPLVLMRDHPANDFVEEELAGITDRQPGSRVVLTDEHLSSVADLYREGLQMTPHTPTKYVVDALARPKQTVSRWLKKAHDRGLLPEYNGGSK